MKQASAYSPRFSQGLNRRDFLQRTTVLSTLATLGLSKPLVSHAQSLDQFSVFTPKTVSFTPQQQQVIEQVQLVLFPDDGDGPSAADLHGFDYLSWALTEEDNKADGDFEFILKGITWLNDLSLADYLKAFITLDTDQKNILVEKISKSKSGKNWLSLLLYYLLESLTLDPLYSGNRGTAGWQWLKHQPGFPRPDAHTHFQNFIKKEDS